MRGHWTDEEREAVLSRSFDAQGLGEARLVELVEGPGRGQRLLQVSNSDGIDMEIALDRGFDIARLRYRGRNIGWIGPTDYPAPINADGEDGLGALRSFGGFLVTCGLDHFGLPEKGSAAHLQYPNRPNVVYPLHGRISATPANSYTVVRSLETDTPSIICTGNVRQSGLFNETIELRRTIEIPLLSGQIRIEDRVTNMSRRPVRHGVLYHVNLGYPFLDDSLTVDGIELPDESPICRGPTPASQDAEMFGLAKPKGTGLVSVRVTNPELGGLSLALHYDTRQLPNFGVWRAYQEGIFALGLEPHTSLGPAGNQISLGRPDVLAPREARTYDLAIHITDDRT